MKTLINHRWEIELPEHRASLPQWPFWEKERLTAMYDCIRLGDTIIDVGAEQGDLTALFATWSQGPMIIIEPSVGFWPSIKTTFELNKLEDPQLSFIGFAGDQTIVSDLEQIAKGWPSQAHGEINPETGFEHINENQIIPRLKLDNLIDRYINVINIDVEGTEYEVIKGAESILKEFRPLLFVSVHPEFMWKEHHHSPDDLHIMLDHWGYDGTYLAFDHEQHWMYKPR